jgi:hypothetical protein
LRPNLTYRFYTDFNPGSDTGSATDLAKKMSEKSQTRRERPLS